MGLAKKTTCGDCDGSGIRVCECGGVVIKKGHLIDGVLGTHFECSKCDEWYVDDLCARCEGEGVVRDFR